MDDDISKQFEPGVPPPSERLQTIEFCKQKGLACGMFLLPVIPFITDKPEFIKEAVRKASEVAVDFIIFGGMTLKEGRQKDYFYQRLEEIYPDLLPEYHLIYKNDKWGNAISEYYDTIQQAFGIIADKYHVPKRIPPRLFRDLVSENNLVIIILEHLDYLLKLKGKPSPYGYAANSISKLHEPLSTMKNQLQEIKGVGEVTERIILEILETSSSAYYETLLPG
jgi:hypothetical protein